MALSELGRLVNETKECDNRRASKPGDRLAPISALWRGNARTAAEGRDGPNGRVWRRAGLPGSGRQLASDAAGDVLALTALAVGAIGSGVGEARGRVWRQGRPRIKSGDGHERRKRNGQWGYQRIVL